MKVVLSAMAILIQPCSNMKSEPFRLDIECNESENHSCPRAPRYNQAFAMFLRVFELCLREKPAAHSRFT
jgi:hypothetical protein